MTMELLTNQQMQTADRLTIASGVTSFKLMQQAASSVAQHIRSKFQPDSKVVVACGPGNNGGDGYIVAQLLSESGFKVEVWSPLALNRLSGDAEKAKEFWGGEVAVGDPPDALSAQIIVDGLFGSGLRGPLRGTLELWVNKINQAAASQGTHVVSIDVPSGLNGDTGNFEGISVQAHSTVTFFRRKPAHLLLPGRFLCGDVVVTDIGIKTSVLDSLNVQTFENGPSHSSLWLDHLPMVTVDNHKYDRGHTVVYSGPVHATGAARLSAAGALRIGSGLVTLASPLASVAVNAAHLTAVMIKPISQLTDFETFLNGNRISSVVLGPANGVGEQTRNNVVAALKSNTSAVLDADALTSFENNPNQLFDAIAASNQPVVITPHDGEYARLFDMEADENDRLSRAQHASKTSGAIVVLKGADTVIASPDGRAAINSNAPPNLATAGSGDVLAGFIGGLLAQKMPPFEAACAGVWLHGQCANEFGQGLISEDLPSMLPQVLTGLRQP